MPREITIQDMIAMLADSLTDFADCAADDPWSARHAAHALRKLAKMPAAAFQDLDAAAEVLGVRITCDCLDGPDEPVCEDVSQ